MERRKTKQRDSVFEAVMELNHPTANDVYEHIIRKKKTGMLSKKISLGTVYRNLQILEETGNLASIYADPLVMYYDHRLDPHYHIKCVSCGAVRDVDMDYRAEINQKVEILSGWEIESHSLAFSGLCPECKTARAEKTANGGATR
ncbi:MAG: transcriptional repressor [Spirochaetaceae bacterium]|jgi:Fe2+ or Zn2+ uptake regulation protein|nr:transcriptional repressor [Spirochaetaceae bacterium]